MLTKVTGVTFSNEDGTSRASIIASMSEDDEIILERDPLNQYDSNAVKVCVKKDGKVHQFGFVEKALASKLSPKMRRGAKFDVYVESCGIYMDRPYCEIELDGVEYDDDGELVFE
jgi:uncharacterized protein YycO